LLVTSILRWAPFMCRCLHAYYMKKTKTVDCSLCQPSSLKRKKSIESVTRQKTYGILGCACIQMYKHTYIFWLVYLITISPHVFVPSPANRQDIESYGVYACIHACWGAYPITCTYSWPCLWQVTRCKPHGHHSAQLFEPEAARSITIWPVRLAG